VQSIDWGDVPTWLASIFGAGAFGGALLLFRVEARRDKRQQELSIQSQAELVTAWIKKKPGFHSLQLCIQNSSKACAYELYVAYEVPGKILGYVLYDVAKPQSDAAVFDVPVHVIEADYDDSALRGYSGNIRPVIYFRDSANRQWKRDYNGYLSRIDADEMGYRAAYGWFEGEIQESNKTWRSKTKEEFMREYGRRVEVEDSPNGKSPMWASTMSRLRSLLLPNAARKRTGLAAGSRALRHPGN